VRTAARVQIPYMATKAQQEKAKQERSGPKRAPKPRKVKTNSVNTAVAAISATAKRARGADSGTENESKHGGRNAVVVLEESASGKRSRKSTRAGAHRGKNSSQLEYAQQQKVNRPSERHARRG
jgi:hypothetical protein